MEIFDFIAVSPAHWGVVAVILSVGVITTLFEPDHKIARALALFICGGLAVRYAAWRVAATLPPLASPVEFGFGLLFLIVEFGALAGTCLSYLSLSRTKTRSRDVDEALARRGPDEPWPLVDVLICTYNEDAEILERTILGACHLDYPNFRVWVCDDGRRDWLKALCERLGARYITRPDNAHAKAGNINSALRHIQTLAERPRFISILDADFVPRAVFLKRTTALAEADDVGVVQTPQHFINPDPLQANLGVAEVWPDEQRFFFDIVLASKDAWGEAFCCGTSSLIRFAPLQAIGGFPTDSVTEDYLVTLRLREAGFRTVYLNEPLTIGLAPEGLKEYIVQRSRWCLGFMQIFRGKSGPFSVSANLKLFQRLSLIENFLIWTFMYGARLLALLVPPLYLLLGVRLVYADTDQAIGFVAPALAANVATFYWISKGRFLPIVSEASQVVCAPEILASGFVGLLFPRDQKFKVTAKGGDRSVAFIQWAKLRIFLLLILFNVAGILWAFRSDAAVAENAALGPALFWSWYNILVLLVCCGVCFERARYRRSERGPCSIESAVMWPSGVRAAEIIDISLGGCRIVGEMNGAVGDKVLINVDGRWIEGACQRLEANHAGISFTPSAEIKQVLVKLLYDEIFSPSQNKIDGPRVIMMIAKSYLGLYRTRAAS